MARKRAAPFRLLTLAACARADGRSDSYYRWLKAKYRDDFPLPIVDDGRGGLYEIEELRAWDRLRREKVIDNQRLQALRQKRRRRGRGSVFEAED